MSPVGKVEVFVKIILCSLIGFMVVHRTISILRRGRLVAREHHHRLRYLYVVVVIPFCFSIGAMTTVTLITSAIVLLTPYLFALIVENRRRRAFQRETVEFYDELIFFARSGRSLRAALSAVAEDPRFGFYSRELAAGVLNGAPGPELKQVSMLARARELEKILQSGGRVVDRLRFFRRLHRLEEKFRRKSSIATQQVRAQALITVLLYAGLAILQLVTGTLKPGSIWFLGSLPPLIFGLWVLGRMARRFRWKV